MEFPLSVSVTTTLLNHRVWDDDTRAKKIKKKEKLLKIMNLMSG